MMSRPVRMQQLQWAITWVARVGVAATFAVAAVPKMLEPAAFAEAIANYQAFPHWSWNLLATVVPMMELLGAVSVVTGWKRRGGAVLLGALTLGFLLLIGSVIARGIDVSCGCFGSPARAEATGWPELARDLLLLLGVFLAAREPGANRART